VDQNLHRVRAMMDEVFGDSNSVCLIAYNTTSGQTSDYLSNPKDYLLWYAKSIDKTKFRKLYTSRKFDPTDPGPWQLVERNGRRIRLNQFLSAGGSLSDPVCRIVRLGDATSQRQGRAAGDDSAMGFAYTLHGKAYRPSGTRGWSTTREGMNRAERAQRLVGGGNTLSLLRYFDEFPYYPVNADWGDTGVAGFTANKVYVVQTSEKVVQRCLLMVTDPGDLVLDPSCGSGTTAAVAEQWGRRWITIDTSRVALALARCRIMGTRYPYYLLADSSEGKLREAELTCSMPSADPVSRNIRQGFVYERVPHITLKSIANNTEIDTIWEKWQSTLEPLREQLNTALVTVWQEWEIPREAQPTWSDEAKSVHANWWDARIARQKEIDASIAAKADSEYLYDKPYEDKSKVRVAGPFTVESLSPHRTIIVNDDDTITDPLKQGATAEGATDFAQMILNTLRVAGVQQAHKQDRISFEALDGWPGELLAGKGTYRDADGTLKTAGIFIGPEFGTVTRVDLVEAARECADAGFNVLISCAFNYEAQSTDFDKLGPIPVLKARMNADLHMQQDLANSGKGNLFVIFGEPDIDILDAPDDQIQVKINGVDVFDPSTGEVRSDEPDNIACWFIDSDYNQESFFVRQAYFLGQNDPYKSLKTSLKADIDLEAWESLNSDTSVPFAKPTTGRIAVKVINHLGDEVMKVYRV
jgi:adenine-specific DNA-methyltransferase